MKVTFWFPGESGLKSIDVEGAVPRVGENVYVSGVRLDSSYNKGSNHWVVDRVDYGVKIYGKGDASDILYYKADVHLVKPKEKS